jgi:hypothetical protein
MKWEERVLLSRIAARQETGFACPFVGFSSPLVLKQTLAMLDKWDRKGWWTCGVSQITGWLTPKGREAALTHRFVLDCLDKIQLEVERSRWMASGYADRLYVEGALGDTPEHAVELLRQKLEEQRARWAEQFELVL